MRSFLAETGHVGEWDRTSSTKSWGGYNPYVNQDEAGCPQKPLLHQPGHLGAPGYLDFDDEEIQVFRPQSAGDSAFHLDSPD